MSFAGRIPGKAKVSGSFSFFAVKAMADLFDADIGS